MRVLLSTIGSRGDVQPLVALATHLRALGTQVRLCVPPDFVEWITALGFDAVPVGPWLRAVTTASPAQPMTPERRRELAEASVVEQFTTVERAADGCDAVVGATALQLAAPTIAEARGLPYVFTAYCPDVVPSDATMPLMPTAAPGDADAPPTRAELWARDGARFHALFGPTLNAQRQQRGLAPVDDTRAHVLSNRPWLAADAALAPWPGHDHLVRQTGAWLLPDDRPLPDDLARFLDAGAPPVYFGFGSMRGAPGLADVFVEAARAVGRRAVIARGWAGLEPTVSGDDWCVVGEVNQRALFARVAAVVHHGGAGTTTCAAAAGTPQVVVPQIYDQPYWAQRVAVLGIGVAHARGTPTGPSLIAALTQSLDADTGERARRWSSHVRLDGADRAARHVRALLDGSK